jgi:hypothetical protein
MKLSHNKKFDRKVLTLQQRNEQRTKVAGVSAAQVEARIHNYTKMVVCAARANLRTQANQDKRLNDRVRFQLKMITTLLNDVVEEWK